MLCNPPSTHPSAGFGLIELLVTMSIMTLVSTIVLVNQGTFNNAIVLRNQTYEIAFMLRQAQLVAVSGTDNRVGDGQRFGVQINRSQNSVTLFSDTNNSGTYNAGDTVLDSRRLDSRFEIDAVSIGSTNNVAILHVIFERPNFDAQLRDGGTLRTGVAEIVVSSRNGGTSRVIQVTNSGNISVISN